ncbi:MAG: hypothetical protein ACRDJI_03510 [Actinomycetota bacterium]
MTSGEIVITVFIGFVSAGLGALFWARLNRLEGRIDSLSDKVAQMVTRDEFREEMARLRSDLTQVALAVGASRPQASEG